MWRVLQLEGLADEYALPHGVLMLPTLWCGLTGLMLALSKDRPWTCCYIPLLGGIGSAGELFDACLWWAAGSV